MLGLEPSKGFKVGLKCRDGDDAGVAGVVWTDIGSSEEGGVGWRRGMKDTVVQLESKGGEEGEEEEEEKEGEHGKTGLDEGRSRPGLAGELVWPGSDWLS